jgi:hypothetical protein
MEVNKLASNKRKKNHESLSKAMTYAKKRPDMFERIDPKITDQELSLLLGKPLSPCN